MSWDDPARTGDDAPARGGGRRPPADDEGARGAGRSEEDEARYAEHDALGSGASGRIVRAHDRRLARDVALKIAAPERPLAQARLRREAAVLAALEHPGIVPIYDLHARADGGLQLALKIVRGQTLDRAMAEAPGDRARWLSHLLRASQAVAYAHARGVVHRDLKPANIMIGAHGETQVIDWGLALAALGASMPIEGGAVARLPAMPIEGRAVARLPAMPSARDDDDDAAEGATRDAPDDARLTHVGAVVGTPAYMAPEQARGAKADARADVWSLGAILYELACGQALVADVLAVNGAGARAVVAALREGRVPSDDALAKVPRDLAPLVKHALARDPEARLADAGAFAKALDAALAPRRKALGMSLLGLGAITALAAGLLSSDAREPSPARDTNDAARAGDVAGSGGGATSDASASASAADTAVAGESARDDASDLRALGDRRSPESAALAVRTLAAGPSADARGVLAALDLAHAPRFVAALAHAPCGAAALAADARHWLCREPARVRVFDGATFVWQAAGANAGAVFVDGGARVLVAEPDPSGPRLVTYDTASGARLGGPIATDCDGPLVAASGGVRAFVHRGDCLVVRSPARVHRLASPMALQAATVGDDGTWAGIVGGGALAVGAYDDEDDNGIVLDVIVASRLVPERDVVAMASLPGRRVAIGTSGGELIVAGLDGRVQGRRQLAPALIAAIAASPSGERVAVVQEGRGPLVLDARLAPRARLPERDAGPLRFSAEDALVTLGATRLATWSLARTTVVDPPRMPELAALALDDDDLFVAHGATLTRLALPSRELAAVHLGDAAVGAVALAPDRALLVTRALTPRLELRSRHDLTELAPALPLPAAGRALAVTAGADPIAVIATYGHALLAGPTRAGEPRLEPIAAAWVEALAARGATLALLDDAHEIVQLAFAPEPREDHRCLDAHALVVAPGPWPDTLAVMRRDAVAIYDASCEIVAWLVDDAPLGLATPGAFAALELAPDGRFVAVGARDGRVLVWRADEAMLAARLRLPGERVTALAYAPDGTSLVAGTAAGSLVFVDLAALDATPGALAAAVHDAWGL